MLYFFVYICTHNQEISVMSSVKNYSPYRKAYLSHELFDKYRYNLGMYSHKLLLGLAQSLDVTHELFPTWHIDIRHLFKYLNIESNNQRYEIVKNAFFELSKNPIEWKVSDTRWGVMSWLSYANYDEENNMFINIKFNPDVKPFLLQLRQFCELETRHYVKLGSNYGMWLYSHLKNAAKKGTHIMSIERLKEITYTENLKSYNQELKSDATRSFLKNVIGIQRNVKTKTWEFSTRKDRKTGEMVKYGAMQEINQYTDLEVSFEVLKGTSGYDRVKFLIRFKSHQQVASQPQPQPRGEVKKSAKKKVAPEQAEIDFGPRRNPGEIPGDKWISIPYKEAFQMSIAAGIPIEEFLKRNGYVLSKNKKYVCKLRPGPSDN